MKKNETNKDTASALFKTAVAQHQAKQFSTAEQNYRALLLIQPNHPEANHNLGMLLANELKKINHSFDLLKQAVTYAPTNALFWMDYISTLRKAKKFSDVLTLLPQARTYIPEIIFQNFSAQQTIKISQAYINQKNWHGAINTATQGLQYAAKDAHLWRHLGFGCLQLCRYEDAVKAFTRSIELMSDAGTWNLLGVANCALHLYKNARNAFQKSIKLNPTLHATWSNAAFNEVKLLNFEQAESCARNAIELNPKSEKAHFVLGILALRKGTLEDSIKALQVAITAATLSPQSLFIPETQAITVVDARKALMDARECLGEANIPFFLCAGTLLGIIRDGNILSFDKDMDIGLAAHIDRQEALNALTANGQFRLNNPELATPEKHNWNFSVVHTETNIGLDLFFYHPDKRHFLCGFNASPTPVLSRPKKFKIEELIWQGVTWQIPSPPEQYLADIYGKDWGTPDPLFDTVISSHCQTPESWPARRCFGYIKLYESLTKNKWHKAYGYCVQILQRDTDIFIKKIQDSLYEKYGNTLNLSVQTAKKIKKA